MIAKIKDSDPIDFLFEGANLEQALLVQPLLKLCRIRFKVSLKD
jgi:hypothetical protein